MKLYKDNITLREILFQNKKNKAHDNIFNNLIVTYRFKK